MEGFKKILYPVSPIEASTKLDELVKSQNWDGKVKSSPAKTGQLDFLRRRQG